MLKAAITTFGCKLNQYESEQMRQQLEQLGYQIVDFRQPADLYIINSCTVTGRTDRDSRRLARRIRRRQPEAFILLTGCYAQVAAVQLRIQLPEVNLIIGHEAKNRLAELIPRPPQTVAPPSAPPLTNAAEGQPALQDDTSAPVATSLAAGSPPPRPQAASAQARQGEQACLIDEFAGHTRCFVKVQEGCNARCTYCLIPAARGPSRSVPLDEVLTQTRRLARAGHPELVLIGTHLGQYGRDLPDCPNLDGLIEKLCHFPEVQRLRLSSIEPCEITPRLESWIAAGGQALARPGNPAGKLCRHLHIPLQSGCDAVLERMNRPYQADFYADLVSRIYQRQPLTGLGADVIVGFPGETEAEFQQTAELLADLPLAYLHVFTYSPRPGTAAAEMSGQLDHEVRLARNHRLRQLSEIKRQAFMQALVGQQLEVVVQSACDPPGWFTAVADNYMTVRLPAPPSMAGQLVSCQITALKDGLLLGKLTD